MMRRPWGDFTHKMKSGELKNLVYFFKIPKLH
jgi:hypothetical protein